MTADAHFHIPVFRGAFFEDATHEAINVFLADAPVTDDGTRIRALRTDFLVSAEDRENVIGSGRLCFYGEASDGRTVQVDPRGFRGDLRDRYASVAAAMSCDDLGVQSVASCPLPWHDPRLEHRMLGRLFTHIQARDFALFGVEYPPIWIGHDTTLLAGRDAPESERRLFMSLILPDLASAHAMMEERKKQAQIRDLAERLYGSMLDGHAGTLPLAPVDLTIAKPL